jgi:gluconate 2-dehydrogenase gamma chain
MPIQFDAPWPIHPGRGAFAHVSDLVKNGTLDRRTLLLGAVFLVGGAAALTRFTRQPAGSDRESALTSDQFALLEQVADVIIPATDTPGAIDAGVPVFVRDMLEVWASTQTRAELTGVLDAIEQRSWAKYGTSFLELSPERRLDLVREFDEEALSREDLAYGRFKYLVLVGYYHSEIGATQELRFELVPGAWRSCLPLNEVGRASAV